MNDHWVVNVVIHEEKGPGAFLLLGLPSVWSAVALSILGISVRVVSDKEEDLNPPTGHLL